MTQYALLTLALSALAGTTLADAAKPVPQYERILQEMPLSDPEKNAIRESIKLGRDISRIAETRNGLPYRRDAHAKATGCVRARFSIRGDIPERYQHSIFSAPGHEYQAWIRFSNGDMEVQKDSKPDARGMAVKVMGVEGDKIAPEFTGPATHDLIMTNTPAFFHRNVMDYVEDMHYLAKLERTRWFISFFPPRLHPKQFYRAIQTVSSKIDSPLQPQYYSMLPYQLGHTEVKFSARPCVGEHSDVNVDRSHTDYLTEAMQSQLDDGTACFDFMLQERKPGANMPLDDATVIWSEEEAPFLPVARIDIPSQTFTSEAQSQFCEDLSMNPWHAVGEWRPLSSLGMARRVVYAAVSEFRHDKNGAEVFQPVNWCLEPDGQCDQSDLVKPVAAVKVPTVCFDPLYQDVNSDDAAPSCRPAWP